MKTVTTNKGTALPLINLKGKDYLQVAHRIQWFTEEEKRYVISTEFLSITDDQTVCKATITTYNENGLTVRSAQGTKRETKKDFPDHTEKAETGALGRALIQLGYGTQFALSDLDEGMRLVDSPLTDVKQAAGQSNNTTSNGLSQGKPAATPSLETQFGVPEPYKKGSSFSKNKKPTEAPVAPVLKEQPATPNAEAF